MWLGQFAPAQVNLLRFWIGTERRWLQGQMHTIHRRLADALNAEADQMLLVDDLFRCDRPGNVIRGSLPISRGGIAVAQALVCLPIEDSETPAPTRDPYAYVVKSPERVVLGVGPFEIEGVIHLPDCTGLEDTLGTLNRRFLPVTGVRLRRLDDPSFFFEAPVAIVNGRQVEYLV
ncbi:MAG: hypothetical protein ACYC7H_04985, partial [Chloroflexota bacterium]